MTSQRMIIAGRFAINDIDHDLLGRGGMGEVYRALDMQTGETVAVKALNPDVLKRDPALLERFIREGEALRQLNHPNIVHMIAAVQEEGRHYLAMEFVDTGSLRDLLGVRGCLPSTETVKIALEVADALARAHHLGIIHRDLKPANVLLARDGTPRLADFGIAHIRQSPQLTQTGVLLGTIDYLSPELCQGEPPSELSDIWAFGVMLFEMLAGSRPFNGDSLTAKITAILTQPVPDLAQLAPGLPDSLTDLVYRMLQKDPQQRIPSIRLVGAELEAVLQGRELVRSSRSGSTGSRFEPATPVPNTLRHNLPPQPTAFVGRQAELTEVARLLTDAQVRLLTILGAGGMGKTRLALEAGAAQKDKFKDGVYFVSLAPLESTENMIPTLAQAIGLKFHEHDEPRLQLLGYLGDKHLLLIMDNFEHLLQGTSIVTEILQAAPQVKILSTSRLRLGLESEYLFHLEGMDFPDFETPVDALKYSAVRLFLQGARRVRPGFELDAGNIKFVSRICRLAGGMPLGILLAAAWVEMLTPQEIAGEMQRGLDFLATGQASIPERQRSMQAIFDYSWNLLTEKEKDVFCGLSVFRGGFTRDAAQVVTGATLRELRVLMDKSLLQRLPSGRYDMHELLRQYGEQKLLEAGKENISRQRHLEYFLSLAEHSWEKMRLPEQIALLRSINAELDNLRIAMDWSLASGCAQMGLRLIAGTQEFWTLYGHSHEGRNCLERLLEATPETTLERARGLEALGDFASWMGDDAAAMAACRESLSMAEALGDLQLIADATCRLGQAMTGIEDIKIVRPLLERSLKLAQDLDRPGLVAWVYLLLGELARSEGDQRQAREMCERAMFIHNRLGKKNPVLFINLALVLIHFDELERSRQLLQESYAIIKEMGNKSDMLSFILMGSAFLARARNQPARAAKLLGASETLDKTIYAAARVSAGDKLDYEQNLAALRTQLEKDAFEALWQAGAALTLEQAIDLASQEDYQEESTHA